MNHATKVLCRRNIRAYISAFIAYLMLAGQAAPLALAARPRAATPAQKTASTQTHAPRVSYAPQPAPLVGAPNIVATKVDSWDDSATPDGKAEPGQTITYTVTITNNGTADATGVAFNDSVDTNTTLVGGSVNTQPIAIADTYNVIGNVRIQPNAAAGLLANDRDPDTGNNTGLTASGPSTSTQGGNVTINSDGSFSYNPAPGFTGTDTFTYTITDGGGKTDTAVATFNVGNGTAAPGSNVVWFVNPAAPSGGDGRLTNPFNCYTGVSASCFSQTAADDPGDTIFLYTGSLTGGYTLLNNQKLVGAGASDTLANISGLTVQAYSDALPSTGTTAPTITTTNVNAVPLGQGNTLRGFTIGNVGTGAKISGSNFGTLVVGNSTTPDVTLNGTGQALNLSNGTLSVAGGFSSVTTTSSGTQGINLAGVADSDGAGGSVFSFGSTTVSGATTQGILIGTTTADLNLGNVSVTGGTDGISFQNNSAGTRTIGTLGVSGGSGNAFLHGAGGGNVTITGAATLSSAGSAVSVNAPGGTNAINFQGVTSATSTGSGNAGVNWVGASGASLSFNTLTIQTNAGTGLNATTGGTVTVTNNTGTINNTTQAAAAIIGNAVTLNLNFTTVNSSGGTNGISLTNVAGTLNLGSGALSGSSGVEFLTNGGAASVTYNGTITQTTAARVIDVQNKSGGTFSFGGAITSNNGTGQGIFLNANSSTTFNFTAGLALSTAGNDAFTATSSGTINATQNNTSIVNTLTTTTGQALKVTSTTIGASGLTFRSISSNGGTNNGITLDTTGSGNFTITGNGTAASGGTIQNKNGADGNTSQGYGIYMNAVSGAVSLTRIDIEGCQNYGIRGITVSGGFTLDNSTVGNTSKNGTTYTDSDADTAVQGEGSVRFLNLTGTATISNSTLDNGFARTILIHNNTGTLNLSLTNTTLKQSLNGGNGGSANTTDGMFMQGNNSATMNLTVTGCTITAYRQFAFSADARDSATMDIDIGTSNFSNSNTGIVAAAGAINFGGSGGSANDVFVRYNIHNNTFRHGSGGTTPNNGGAQIVSGGVSGGVKFDGKILNNTFGVSGVPFTGSGNAADVLRLFASGNNTATTRVTGSTHTRYLVQGNTIQRYGEVGIQINARQGNSTIDATILGNIIREPGAAAQGAFAAIWVNSGALPADTNQVNIGIGSASVAADKNTMQDSDPSNATDVFLDNKTCGGCASTLNLYQNGSDAAGATTEAKASDVIKDDNNPTLDLLTGFTNGSTIGFVPGLPPQPTVAQTVPPTGSRNRGTVTMTESQTPSDSTRTQGSVTSAPFVSPRTTSTVALAPRTIAPTTPTRTTANTSTSRNTSPTTSGTSTANREPLTPVIDGAGGTVSVNIGTLAPNDSVTITFQVTIDNPYTGGPNVSNQGTVSGSNFSNVLTNDPDTAAPNDATLTPINLTNIQVNDAKQPEPATGTSQMLFVVTLSAPAAGSGLSVNYSTANGGGTPATGGASCDGSTDYITASGTLTIPVGSKTGTIPVTICSDAVSDDNETLLMNISSPSTGNITDAQATGTITANTPGTFIISEFRHRGPSSTTDDFVELYNNTDSPLTVAASDASGGYGLYKMGATCNDTPVLIGTIPNGTIIPARGHYLLVGSGYSLANYGGTGAAAGNQTLTADIEDDRNIAVFSTANIDNISSANRLDAVGFGTNNANVCDLMREGTTLAPVGAVSGVEYSYFRKECDFSGGCLAAGNPRETNNNANDFLFADTQGTFIAGIPQHLGAPGPENLSSPIRRDNSGVLVPLLDATKASSVAPNRDRTFTPAPPTAPNGVLSIRRRIQNTTGSTVTRLRFRIIEMTTFPSPGAGTADLRAITSSDVVISGINDASTCASTGTPATVPCQVTVKGTTLEQPPTQANGGGYNSSFSVSIPGGLPNNQSVDVNFALGVVQGGTFRFYIIVEALP